MSKKLEHLENKTILGLIEQVKIITKNNEELTLDARIDTGAQNSSIDISLAEELKLGPVVKEKIIKQSMGSEKRKVIKISVKIKDKKISGLFTLSNRSKMKYSILIGQNLLKKGDFLIDPNK